ncbi:thiamine phosphate synthase [Stomatobaculum longum]|uniref:thiamine phosphate synthase n=1 Tax=Stomatobaculum longum TaxID=796942 RepID=UPI0028DBEC37|nr:thiamine phosphate synthase [Stomatobaculum longum]
MREWTKEELRRALLLYAVSSLSSLRAGETLYGAVKELLDGGITMLQWRVKEKEDAVLAAEREKVQALCRAAGIPFLMNDSLEAFQKSEADGVHLGQTDLREAAARSLGISVGDTTKLPDGSIKALVGRGKILGITARSVEAAREAERLGADYIGAGAVFGTATKADALPLSLAAFREITEAVSIPVVAIGGINEDNVERLFGSGAAGIAVVSALFGAEERQATAAVLRAKAEALFGNKN